MVDVGGRTVDRMGALVCLVAVVVTTVVLDDDDASRPLPHNVLTRDPCIADARTEPEGASTPLHITCSAASRLRMERWQFAEQPVPDRKSEFWQPPSRLLLYARMQPRFTFDDAIDWKDPSVSDVDAEAMVGATVLGRIRCRIGAPQARSKLFWVVYINVLTSRRQKQALYAGREMIGALWIVMPQVTW